MPWLAKRNTEHGGGLGRWRWVVERSFAWLNQFRRLRVRYEKRADIHDIDPARRTGGASRVARSRRHAAGRVRHSRRKGDRG
jgi:transposase